MGLDPEPLSSDSKSPKGTSVCEMLPSSPGLLSSLHLLLQHQESLEGWQGQVSGDREATHSPSVILNPLCETSSMVYSHDASVVGNPAGSALYFLLYATARQGFFCEGAAGPLRGAKLSSQLGVRL